MSASLPKAAELGIGCIPRIGAIGAIGARALVALTLGVWLGILGRW